MNELLNQAQFHARRCEHHARLAMIPLVCGFERVQLDLRNANKQLASYHAVKAFDLSAKAAAL